MKKNKERLISLLASSKNAYISGENLSEELQVTRTSIWKYIKELKEEGYEIEAIRKKGYMLKQIPLHLSESVLKWDLKTAFIGQNIIYRPVLSSTQDMAHELARSGCEAGTLVIADKQTSGRGRLNREWESNHSGGIWMSLVLRPEIAPNNAPQLTLLSAVAVSNAIEKLLAIDVQIKWPNDIFLHNKKLAGILTEMQAEVDKINYLVIGIGINVNQQIEVFGEELQSKVISLKELLDQEIDRKTFIHCILEEFELLYNDYLENGFKPIQKSWVDKAYKIGEEISLKTPKKNFKAIFEGIEHDGSLLVENSNGDIEKIYSAEIDW
ncbi:biotin--[acetyl-CoA-carboxylase] ligase [Saliterribacillus persicus]|uniref:Bifunctional ligase/repressor BirA n=1 Tax=Saliterribacillus persicus TaxID=930114 RepID=A0A368XFZ5_9BACI|nr:biotin--[acetyl-CoA-carboxylase] ligase [Saliterribacillus persicus]RCW64934.1 BirA family biotin operon repressor/biotin-[acetyl-CoA-carboxylase] ligase [Saliterribacillus persicus]